MTATALANKPRSIRSLPPLLSAASLIDVDAPLGEQKKDNESAEPALTPMPIDSENVPFHLDPRRGSFLTFIGEE